MSDIETQLAETHAALNTSEAEAALLRQAIETYLGDVTIGVEVLRAVVRETSAGAQLLNELAQLRALQQRTADALVNVITQRPGASPGMEIRRFVQRWLLRRWGQE